jgi:hypothetical protein
MEDVEKMSGGDLYKRAPKNLLVNEVKLNGEKGEFLLLDLVNKVKGEKTVQTSLGGQVNVIFLKHRRRLNGWNNDQERYWTSTEHNAKTDICYLFGADEKGISGDLRNKHEKIVETQHLAYAFLLRKDLPRELVRVVIRGASLGSKSTEKGVTKLYDYLASFAKNEHSYEYVTEMFAVKEKGKMKEYFVTDFKRGAKMPDDKMPVVLEEIKRIYEVAQEQDEYYQKAESIKEDLPTIDMDVQAEGIEYPEEKINPEDIPF